MCHPPPPTLPEPLASPTSSPAPKEAAMELEAASTDGTSSCSSSKDGLPSASEMAEEVRRMGGIAVPMAWLGLVYYGRMAASVYYLGRLGAMELAGGTLAIGLANITCYSVLSGLAMGMEPICGQAYGAGEWGLMAEALQRTVILLMAASVPIAGLWLGVRPFLVWCGQDAELSSMAATYLLYSLPDLVAMSFLLPLRIYLRTQSRLSPLSASASASLALHLPLAFVLSSRLRLPGVALASAASNFHLLASLLLYLRLSRSSSSSTSRSLVRRRWRLWDLSLWKPLLSLSIPSCASVCLEWWWYELIILFSAFLLHDPSAIAATGILIQTTSLLYIFPSSLSLALSTRISNELGAGRPSRARLAAFTGLLLASALAAAALAFSAAVRRSWGAAFTPDRRISSLVAAAMPILGLCELGNCPQTAGCGVLRGSARPSSAANINLGSFYAVGLPVALLLGRRIGFVGLWLGLLAAQLTCAALMLFVVGSTDWELQARRAKQLLAAAPPLAGGAELEEGGARDLVGGDEHEFEELEQLISIKVAPSAAEN